MSSTARRASPVTATVDYDADGVQHGFLRLPHSHDASAWGALMIPITVIRNGGGSTALLTGGNHGDEYEGPLALFDLANSLAAEAIKGRVIIIPAMNYPAFRAGLRTSPIDKGNLNRSFPGSPDGTITQKIADYFQRTLLPMADYVLDFHSGGRTLNFLPFAAAHILPDKKQEERCFEAVKAFGAPYSVKMLEIDAVGMYDTAAEAQGCLFVTTELAGGGTSTPRTVAIARRGVRNFLAHCRIIDVAVEPSETVWLDMPSDECFVFSEDDGVFEALVELGDAVSAGEPVARVYTVGRTGIPPIEYRAKMDGVFVARHFPGLIRAGDCVAVVASPLMS
jgi:N-alpha-acetyl-L-2,4-diaminobutyrate deacetylase